MTGLRLVFVLSVFAFATLIWAQPPGGIFSNCCNGTLEECNHHPVDPNFRPKNCHQYEALTGISCEVRRHFMRSLVRRMKDYWGTNCPFNPFFAIIVNHTGPSIEDADVLCAAASNPIALGAIYHAETRVLLNCYQYITELFGSGQVFNPLIWQKLTLYTNVASCAMCASTWRWTRIGEEVYAISDPRIDELKWYQIGVFDDEVQQSSNRCVFGDPVIGTSYQTRIIKNVLNGVWEPYFSWQFNSTYPCPSGCERDVVSNQCVDSVPYDSSEE